MFRLRVRSFDKTVLDPSEDIQKPSERKKNIMCYTFERYQEVMRGF